MNKEKFNLRRTELITLLIVITTLFLFLQTNFSSIVNIGITGISFHNTQELNAEALIKSLNLTGESLDIFISFADLMRDKSTEIAKGVGRTNKIVSIFDFFILVTIGLIIFIWFRFRNSLSDKQKSLMESNLKILVIYNFIFCFIIWSLKNLLLTKETLSTVFYYLGVSIEGIIVLFIILSYSKPEWIDKLFYGLVFLSNFVRRNLPYNKN